MRQQRWRWLGILLVGGVARNPTGPSDSFDPDEPGQNKRVHRGGSFLCTDQYCSRYMVGTRGKGDSPYELLPAHPGVGQIVLQARPIAVPVFVNGLPNGLMQADGDWAYQEFAGQGAVRTVGVVGSGTMATGIIEVVAKGGYDVVYVGRSDAKVEGVTAAIERSLDKAIQRGKLEESAKAEVLGRLTGSTSLDDLADVDIVVEAIAEDLKVKTILFENLDEICKPGAILATTTSSLPVIACAAATDRPQDVIGMHFFNPAPVMKLVEIITTPATSSEVDETVRALTAKVGKVGVSAGDRAGFHAPRPVAAERVRVTGALRARAAGVERRDDAVPIGADGELCGSQADSWNDAAGI